MNTSTLINKCIVTILFCLFCTPLFAQDSDLDSTLANAREGYKIQPRDILAIKFYRHQDLDQEELEVAPDGTIFLPLIGETKVEGLTKNQFERQLMKIYSTDYLKNPYITVTVLSKRYYVLGEVKAPGAYPMMGNVTVLTAITQAGGFTDYAAENKVSVIRNDGGQKQTIRVNVDKIIKEGDTRYDVLLQPGDVVNIPQSAF